MSLLTEYKEKILPLSLELDKLMQRPDFVVVEDFTIIPVNIKVNGETVRVYESGMLIECYHDQVTNNNCNDCGEFVE